MSCASLWRSSLSHKIRDILDVVNRDAIHSVLDDRSAPVCARGFT